MTQKKKMTKVWKTKKVDKIIKMICMNSDLEESRYPQWAPEDGEKECKEWTEVVEKTTAVLCASCTSRSVNF